MEKTEKKQGLLELQKQFKERSEFEYLFGELAEKREDKYDYPVYVDEEHNLWEGYVMLAMPDDTCIVELTDGSFEIESYDEESEAVSLQSIDDVIDYYLAKCYALGELDSFNERSLAYRQAYKKYLIRFADLINVMDEKVVDGWWYKSIDDKTKTN
jgi:hypothetical protein